MMKNHFRFIINTNNYKVFFYYIIPISGIFLALAYYVIVKEQFDFMLIVKTILSWVLSPYLTGLLWMLIYSVIKGIKKKEQKISMGIEHPKSLTIYFDADTLNIENYMKFVFFAWILLLLIQIFQSIN